MAGVFAGGNNIDDFGERLSKFGQSIEKYGSSISGVDPTQLSSVNNAIKNTINDLNSFSELELDNKTLGDSLSSFGNDIKTFYSSIKGIEADDLSSIVESIKEIANLLNELGSIDIQNAGLNLGNSLAEGLNSSSGLITASGTNLGNCFIIGLSGNSGAAANSGIILGTAGASGTLSSSGQYSSNGISLGSMLALGLMSAGSLVGAAGMTSAMSGSTGALGQIGAYNSSGMALGNGLAGGIIGSSGFASSAGSTLGQAGASGASGQVSSFSSIGANMAAGLASGILSGVQSVVSAAVSIAQSAVAAAKSAAGIHSPSRVFRDEVGRYMVEGMAEGITDDMSAEEAAEKKAQNIVNAFKDALDRVDLKSEISEAWYKLWEYWEGADSDFFERTNKQIELLNHKIELQKEAIDLSKGEYDVMVSEFGEGSDEAQESLKKMLEEQIELEELYKEVSKASYDYSMDWIDTEKEHNRLSIAEEYAAYCRVQARYKKGADEYIEMEKKKYETRNKLVEASYQNSMDWISKEKEFNRLGTAGELAAYKRVKYQLGEILEHAEELDVDREQITEWLEDTESEIYSLQKSIYEAQKQYEEDLAEIREEDANQRLEYEEEYKEKCQEVNDQLEQDIKELDDAYADALESRMDSLYDSYSLFEEVTQKGTENSKTLTKNLQDQVAEFEDWTDQLNSLSEKGLNSELIEELQKMGPSSIAEIRALNSMTDSELAQYATLWGDKHELAKNRATSELEEMRIETQSQISSLKTQAEKDLDELNDIWQEQLTELDKTTNQKITDLTNDYKKEVGLLPEYTEQELNEMVTIANDILSQGNWNELGYNVVMGLVDGMRNAAPTYYDTVSEILNASIVTAQETLDSHSPSRKFAKLGRYIDEGLVVGLNKYSHKVTGTVETIGNNLIGAMGSTISKIDEIECTPTIRPVVDMTDFDNGRFNEAKQLFSAEKSISLSANIGGKIQNDNENLINGLASKLADLNEESNGQIISAIESLKSDFSDLVDRVTSLQMVVDGGALVGAIAPRMDNALGRLSKMNRRGVR